MENTSRSLYRRVRKETENTGNNVLFQQHITGNRLGTQVGTCAQWEQTAVNETKGSLASLPRRPISPIENRAGAFAVAFPTQVSETTRDAVFVALGPLRSRLIEVT